MKRFLFAAFIFSVISTHSYALVSDTITVRHYTINIDTINYPAHTIRGNTTLTVKSKLNNVNSITLYLLQLNIDSIISNGQPLTYSYDDTLIHITSPATLNQNDSIMLTIYYNGQPQQDPSFGGFYFNGQYAFNLGVTFLQDPHTFGRAWFPCIDEFTDRSLYDFYITTDSGYKAFCNGILQGSVTHPNGSITWHWKINESIPSYLACMAVAPFYTLQRTSNGIPVQWAVLPGDTTATLNTFTNLDTAVSSFITAYGPYPWEKIGYTATPVVYGGMEHATSIHISKAFIDGTLNYETLWAHELSHMWWGDKVTCASEQEMWLNEGMATFNEYFFTEKVYGTTAYKNAIRTNHRKVLQFAHIIDGNYYALNNVPHAYTYGNTVYHKGADFAHTLKKYMGDSLFVAGCHGYMSNRAYGNATSAQFRDELTLASGIDMTRFFDDWIFTPGFPHFSIDSVVYSPGGLDHYTVYTRQRTKGNASHIYSMPVDITFSNGIQNDTTVTILIDSATNVFHIDLIGLFNFIALDRNEKISDAISDYEKAVTATGSQVFSETNVTLSVQSVGTSSPFVRIEHNWVKPDDFISTNPGIRLSDYHYWKVDGRFDSTFISAANFNYDGRTPLVSASISTGYIDNTLITLTEDSLVLLYRRKAGDNWSMIPSTTNFSGSHTDKAGSMHVDTLRKGEYVLGYRDYTATSVASLSSPKNQLSLKAVPNPTNGICRLEFSIPSGAKGTISVFDSSGKMIFMTPVFSHQSFINWDTYGNSTGIYTATLFTETGKVSSKIALKIR